MYNCFFFVQVCAYTDITLRSNTPARNSAILKARWNGISQRTQNMYRLLNGKMLFIRPPAICVATYARIHCARHLHQCIDFANQKNHLHTNIQYNVPASLKTFKEKFSPPLRLTHTKIMSMAATGYDECAPLKYQLKIW